MFVSTLLALTMGSTAWADSGDYVMILHCGVLGGLVRLTADVATACSYRDAC